MKSYTQNNDMYFGMKWTKLDLSLNQAGIDESKAMKEDSTKN